MHSHSVARCSRCLLPEGQFDVRLDRSGVCNYCRAWDEDSSRYGRPDQHHHLLQQRLDRFRGEYPYDVAVGLSGGKDSAYVLHRLLSSYDVNVLAVTYDNGFLSDYAWDNVEAIVGSAGVDHFVYQPDWEALRKFYRAALLKVGDPCLACALGGYSLSVKECKERRIPLFVHGRSPMQMFKQWYPGTKDFNALLIGANLSPYSLPSLRKEYRRTLRRIRWLLFFLVRHRATRRRIYRTFFNLGRVRRSMLPEFLGFFLFNPYDEEAMKQTLEAHETGYVPPDNDRVLGHGDCRIHDVAANLYEKRHGVPMVTLEVAVMLRRGLISKEAAQKLLEDHTPKQEEVESGRRLLMERLDVSEDAFRAVEDRLVRKRDRGGLLHWG